MKLPSAIAAAQGNAERLYTLAMLAVTMLKSAHQSSSQDGPTNYAVLSPHYPPAAWWPVRTGSNAYCTGYADALQDGSIVACGAFVCWPEERWGEILDGPRE